MIVNIDHTAERGVPNRVLAAQHFIEFCRSITEPCCGDEQPKRRSLSAKELSAYEASIETIRAYVVGEMDFGETPVEPAAKPD
ncbi:MAG: hypothetical protein QM783_12570 [Phycisphaerales bacterium]